MQAPRVRFNPEAHSGPAWWRMPWPNDATWSAGIGNLPAHPVVRRFVEPAENAGPSPSGATYFVFDGAVPADLRADIVDLESGAGLPAEWAALPAGSRWYPPNTIAVMAVPGFVMREGVPHAVILRSGACTRPSLLDAALAARAGTQLDAAYAPLRRANLDLTDVVAATVLTPADQTRRLRALLETALDHRGVFDGEPTARAGSAGTVFIEGRWKAPRFRTGSGRSYLWGGAGVPEPTGTELVPFGLALPPGRAPDHGWPLILSIHGGGCTYLDRLPEIVGASAPRGMAVAQQTLPFNRGRPKGSRWWGDVAFFNILNPEAAISLFHQAVVEQIHFLSLLLSSGKWPLNPDRVYCIGHSNGGTTAAMLLAVEPRIKAGVVAGFGGHVGTYVEESDVIGASMRRIWPFLVCRSGAAEPRTRFHPVVNLAHTAWGVWDTLHFAPRWLLRPIDGVGSKHIYLAQGFHDQYASVRNTTAVITAAGLDAAGPAAPTAEAGHAHHVLALRGRRRHVLPLEGNVVAGDGMLRTGVVTEHVAIGSGHEVCFEDREVLDRWVSAFAGHAETGRFIVR
jgi:predicted esterase